VSSTDSSRPLLTCGVAAGPFYVVVGLLQMAIRPGFDIRRHALSLLSNGDLGWLQIANFVITGALLFAGAIGMKRAIREGRGSTWAPRMIGLYGIALVGAGIFSADPALGFPPGTPESGTPISWHGMMHFVVGAIGFAGFIAACFILARRHAALHRRAWSNFSWITGVLFLASFVGIASGSKGPFSLIFALAVVLGFSWLSVVFWQLRS
jgi:hypothetical protein